MEYFKREKLAKSLYESMSGNKLLSVGKSGVFLSAPRRTGKTSFIMMDLIPQLESEGVLCIYLDLWVNKDKSFHDVLRTALKTALNDMNLGAFVRKVKNKTGLKNIKLPFGELDLDTVGTAEGLTISDFLNQLLSSDKDLRIALIIDEAQQALGHEKDMNGMYAIKSARDTINLQPTGTRLLLCFTGSNEFELAKLLATNDSPFLGCQITPFPKLGKDFVEFVAQHMPAEIHEKNADLNQCLVEIFAFYQFRPEEFLNAIAYTINQQIIEEFCKHLKRNVQALTNLNYSSIHSQLQELSSHEKFILTGILNQKEKFKPFSKENLDYANSLGLKKSIITKIINDKDSPLYQFIKQNNHSYRISNDDVLRWFNASYCKTYEELWS